jgi:hypothetical protein
MLFSVGYTLPYDRSGVTSPFWHPPDVSFGWGSRTAKKVHFFNNISQTETSVGGLNKAFFYHLRQHKKGV